MEIDEITGYLLIVILFLLSRFSDFCSVSILDLIYSFISLEINTFSGLDSITDSVTIYSESLFLLFTYISIGFT